MPTEQEVAISPGLASRSGNLVNGVKSERAGLKKKGGASNEEDAPKAKSSKKKRKRMSILEQLNYDADADDEDERTAGDSDASENEKENKNARAGSAKTGTGKKKKAKSSSGGSKKKTKTIRDFYSLSPKVGTGGSDDCVAPKEEEATPKEVATPKTKRKAKAAVLNDDAKPIHVHIPFAGQAKNTEVTIDAHCVQSKFDLGDQPLVLSGTYHRRSKVPIERFLSGFGRFCS